MRTTALLAAAGVLLATSATAQGLVPHVGPDGRVYWRRAPMQAVQPPVTRQQYVPPDIAAPERPRGTPRPRSLAPPIDIVPLDPLRVELSVSDTERHDEPRCSRDSLTDRRSRGPCPHQRQGSNMSAAGES